MSNETANRSHAGLVLQMFEAPIVPKILASWGFDDASLTREAALGAGVYSIRLSQAASGLIGPTPILFESIDSLILSSAVVDAPALFAEAILLPDPAEPAPAVGDQAQLPILVISLVDDAGGQDANAVIQLEVRAVPQQT